MAKGKNKDGNIQATPRAATRQAGQKSAFGVLPIPADRGHEAYSVGPPVALPAAKRNYMIAPTICLKTKAESELEMIAPTISMKAS